MDGGDKHLGLSSSFRFTARVHAKVNRINSSPCDLCSACMEQAERMEGRVERLEWRKARKRDSGREREGESVVRGMRGGWRDVTGRVLAWNWARNHKLPRGM